MYVGCVYTRGNGFRPLTYRRTKSPVVFFESRKTTGVQKWTERHAVRLGHVRGTIEFGRFRVWDFGRISVFSRATPRIRFLPTPPPSLYITHTVRSPRWTRFSRSGIEKPLVMYPRVFCVLETTWALCTERNARYLIIGRRADESKYAGYMAATCTIRKKRYTCVVSICARIV